jgi:quercetin dioxygenase-like cupin family protein
MLKMLLEQRILSIPHPAEVMVMQVELPPGDVGTPPHRHSGPVFGYMIEGEMVFRVEAEPKLMIRAGATPAAPPALRGLSVAIGDDLPRSARSMRGPGGGSP